MDLKGIRERHREFRLPQNGVVSRSVVLGCEGEQIVRWVEAKIILAKLSENPRCIILELEVVLGRWRQFISDANRSLSVK